MAINRVSRAILRRLSYGGVEVGSARHFANLKAIDPMKPFYKTMDYKVYNGDYEVPAIIFLPEEHTSDDTPILLFIHGGGWVTESAENYSRVCARMAESTKHIVVAVNYRLSPEYKFPTALEDCYAFAKELFVNQKIDPDKITIIGDSAGGNMAAVLSLMAKDRGEFMPKRQILIYPATNNDYSEESPYVSVKENGTDFLLTSKKLCRYLDMYQSCDEDRNNRYFAPMLAEDLTAQPRTLIITAEYDPLRDEGEAYGQKLKDAGNEVEIHRIEDALHGFFALGIKFFHVQESFEIINEFLKEE